MENTQISKCIDNVVQESSKLLKAKDKDGTLILINLNELKNNHFLQDAHIFKSLFGINKDSHFGHFNLQTDDDGYITLLKEFNISANQWYIFISFIKNGFPPYYLEYKYNKKLKNFVILVIEDLNHVCTCLGGIPTFDMFYNKFYEELKFNEPNIYNPLTPKDDYKNEYSWAIIDNSSAINFPNFATSHTPDDGWSATRMESTYYGFICVWWRKLKVEDNFSIDTDTEE